MTAARLILLTAGGTGGHVFPAEALADELGRRGYPLALVTDRRGATYGGALAGLDCYPISGGGIAGKSMPQRVGSLLALARGYCQARRLIGRLRPAAVIGFGGYASVPAVLAASHKGIPTLLHEQNAVLGRANRLLAPRVAAIATAYAATGRMSPDWHRKASHTGMPVRQAVMAERQHPYPSMPADGPLTLLVMGGSQGARVFSDIVPEALAALAPGLRRRVTISQQCRAEDLDRVRQFYQGHGIAADLRAFFDDVPRRLAEAHLVIARSGASTMAELAAVGRPAILVPYPSAIDDHQTANARAFEEVGAGWLLPQADLSARTLSALLDSLLSAPDRLSQAAHHARLAGVPDAASLLADRVVDLALRKI